MRRRQLWRIAALIFLAVASTGIAKTATAEVVSGRIVSIADGDTVTLLDKRKRQHKIRLIGIDAPERKQAFGSRSRQHLAGLVFDKHVRADCPKKDRYKRSLCTIEVGGVDANLAQVRAGMAWHYKAYQRDQRPKDRARYAAAEERARKERRGLWADRTPQAPWAFRKAKR